MEKVRSSNTHSKTYPKALGFKNRKLQCANKGALFLEASSKSERGFLFSACVVVLCMYFNEQIFCSLLFLLSFFSERSRILWGHRQKIGNCVSACLELKEETNKSLHRYSLNLPTSFKPNPLVQSSPTFPSPRNEKSMS
jgi:hypothetical protein